MTDPWPVNGADAVCALCRGRGWMQTDDEEVVCPQCHGRTANQSKEDAHFYDPAGEWAALAAKPRTIAGFALVTYLSKRLDADDLTLIRGLVHLIEKQAA